MKTMVFLVFTAIYFACFYFLIDLIFTRLIQGINLVLDIACIVCLVAALTASIGLADLTAKKLLENR